MAEQTGDYSELEGPEVPEIVEHVWYWFLELNATRKEGLITYSELEAWTRMNDLKLTPFELDLIRRLDITYLTQKNNG